MALTIQTDREAGVASFEVEGAASLEDIYQVIDAVARQTRLTGEKRALVNLLAVRESLNFTDLYAMGEEVANRLSHLPRLAAVVPAPRRSGTTEKVATARDMGLRVFTTVEEALAWLHEN
jgi:hypothetical protein